MSLGVQLGLAGSSGTRCFGQELSGLELALALVVEGLALSFTDQLLGSLADLPVDLGCSLVSLADYGLGLGAGAGDEVVRRGADPQLCLLDIFE